MSATTWIDAANPDVITEAAESSSPIAGPAAQTTVIDAPRLAVGSGVQDCAEGDIGAMLDGEVSPPRQRNTPLPTAVRRAIEEGYPLAGSPVARAIDPDTEDSVPVDMKGHDEIVYRIRKLDAGHIELGRAIGQIAADVRSGFAELESGINGHLSQLITYADLAEKRAQARDTAETQARTALLAAEAQARATIAAAEIAAQATRTNAAATEAAARATTSGHNVEIVKAKLSYREKIGLAIISVIATMIAGYFASQHISIK